MPARLNAHTLAKIRTALACGWTPSNYLGPFSYLREYRKAKRKKAST